MNKKARVFALILAVLLPALAALTARAGLSCTIDELGISLNTVHAHARSILAKCGVHSQRELIDLPVDAGGV